MASPNVAFDEVRRVFDVTLAIRRSRHELIERAQRLPGMGPVEREALLVALQANSDQLQAVTKDVRARIKRMQAPRLAKAVPCGRCSDPACTAFARDCSCATKPRRDSSSHWKA